MRITLPRWQGSPHQDFFKLFIRRQILKPTNFKCKEMISSGEKKETGSTWQTGNWLCADARGEACWKNHMIGVSEAADAGQLLMGLWRQHLVPTRSLSTSKQSASGCQQVGKFFCQGTQQRRSRWCLLRRIRSQHYQL